jgi:hypothetical protein
MRQASQTPLPDPDAERPVGAPSGRRSASTAVANCAAGRELTAD